MPRSFNVEVFNKVINTGVTYYSDPQFEELLGSADIITLQVIVDATPGGASITATYQAANESSPIAAMWQNPTNFQATIAAPSGTTDVPKAGMTRNTVGDTMGSRGRVTVSTSAQNGVQVRVIACGRSRAGA